MNLTHKEIVTAYLVHEGRWYESVNRNMDSFMVGENWRYAKEWFE